MSDNQSNKKVPSKSHKHKSMGKAPRITGGEQKAGFGENGDLLRNKFPNFFSLSDEERAVFRETLLTARKNITSRGNIRVGKLGTFHDRLLDCVTEESEDEATDERNRTSQSDEEDQNDIPSSTSDAEESTGSGSIPDDTVQVSESDPSESELSASDSETSGEVVRGIMKPESSQGDDTKTVVFADKHPNKMHDFATPKFEQLSPKERKIFFDTLSTAYNNIVANSPKKRKEIIAYTDLVKMYSHVEGPPSPYVNVRTGDNKDVRLRVAVRIESQDNKRMKERKTGEGIRSGAEEYETPKEEDARDSEPLNEEESLEEQGSATTTTKTSEITSESTEKEEEEESHPLEDESDVEFKNDLSSESFREQKEVSSEEITSDRAREDEDETSKTSHAESRQKAIPKGATKNLEEVESKESYDEVPVAKGEPETEDESEVYTKQADTEAEISAESDEKEKLKKKKKKKKKDKRKNAEEEDESSEPGDMVILDDEDDNTVVVKKWRKESLSESSTDFTQLDDDNDEVETVLSKKRSPASYKKKKKKEQSSDSSKDASSSSRKGSKKKNKSSKKSTESESGQDGVKESKETDNVYSSAKSDNIKDPDLAVDESLKEVRGPKTKTRVLQDLLRDRAAFHQTSTDNFIVKYFDTDQFDEGDFAQGNLVFEQEFPDEDERRPRKKRWQTILEAIVTCGRKRRDHVDDIVENLNGESVPVDLGDKSRTPANATLDLSTMRVLEAAKRRRILARYKKT